MRKGSIIEIFLRRQRRRSRGALLAWAAAAAIFAQAWDGAVRRGWVDASPYWDLVLAAAAIYLLVRWCRRVWRLDQRAVAREADARWELRARIESAVELSGGTSAVATAQRADTEQALASREPAGTVAWAGGIAAVFLALGVVAAEMFALHRQAHRPPPVPLAAAAVTQPAPVAPVAPAPPTIAPLRASIVWKSPAHAIQAKAASEIPLVAHAETNRGFRSISLEVAVNGTHRNSFPLAAATVALLAQPGDADLKAALFPDETGAKPYDLISYYLKAEAAPDAAAILSPLQSVEVLPAGASPTGDARYGAEAREMLRRLAQLKGAQLGLFERDFEVIHHPGPASAMEQVAIAAAQAQLTQTAEEARTYAAQIQGGAPVAANVDQAEPLMSQAGDRIRSQDDAGATPLQAQALSLLADAERAFRQGLDAKPTPATPDPFQRLRQAGLSPRSQTPAGRLEDLARRQFENNRRLGQSTADSPDQLAVAKEQAAIARSAARLGAEHALSATPQKGLSAAAATAAEAARQLGLSDPEAAREPAAQAQASLQHAVEAQESEGRAAAAAVLEQVRRELNDADRLKDQAAQEAQRNQAIRELSAEAERQQQQGSADAARKLAALAQQLANSENKPPSPPTPPPEDKSPQGAQTPPSSDSPSAGGSASSSEQAAKKKEDQDKAPPLYKAVLVFLHGPNPAIVRGEATVMLRASQASARVDVSFRNLTSKEIGAHLAMGGIGEKGVSVFALGTGPVAFRSWPFKAVGDLSAASLLGALQAGNLYVEIDTAAYPQGELGGRFLPEGRKNSGSGSGSGSGGGGGGGGGSSSGNSGGHGEERPPVDASSRASSSSRSQAAIAPPLFVPPPGFSEGGEPTGPVIDASVAAAETEAALSPDNALAQTVRQLRAAAAQLSGPEAGPPSLSMLELAAQEARWVTGEPRLADAARSIADGARGDLHQVKTLDPATLKAMVEQAQRLAAALEEAQTAAKRDEWVRHFSPDDIDPDYRKPVEDYFETLSRQGTGP